MRILGVLLLMTTGCAGTAVGEHPVPVAPSLVEQASVELRVGESAALPGTRASVTFIRVAEDSRCPVDVTCVWEGDATVELRADGDGAAPEAVQLHTSPRFSQRATARGVALRLTRLAPSPRSQQPLAQSDYVVTLQIGAP